MTGRDRMVLMVVAVLAVLVGGWILVVSPERSKVSQQEAQVASARSELQGAQAQEANARAAEAGYRNAYAAVVNLGKAVPPLEEVPSLVYELDQISHQRDVDFNSISSGSGGTAGSPSSSAASSGASATPAAFTQMPFTFIFKGSYFELAHLLGQIDDFARSAGQGSTTIADTGGVRVKGRLLTVQGVDIALESQGSSATGGKTGQGELTATITASAYVLPAGQGLTDGATPAGPAGTSAPSASGPPSSPTSSAVIEGAP